MQEVENPMVNEKLHRPEKEILGECAGCLEDVYEGEDVYEFLDTFHQISWVHQKAACCQQFLAEISLSKTTGQ